MRGEVARIKGEVAGDVNENKSDPRLKAPYYSETKHIFKQKDNMNTLKKGINKDKRIRVSKELYYFVRALSGFN